MKTFTIIETTGYSGREYKHTGTLSELVEFYKGTLERGQSWVGRRPSNKNVNTNPKRIDSLVRALNMASHNSSVNGVGSYYTLG